MPYVSLSRFSENGSTETSMASQTGASGGDAARRASTVTRGLIAEDSKEKASEAEAFFFETECLLRRAASSSIRERSVDASSAALLSRSLWTPNDRDAENPPAKAPRNDSSSGASGSQRANTGLVKTTRDCFFFSSAPRATIAADAGAGTSSFRSPSFNAVVPLVSEWRSRASRSASTRATKNDRPPDRMAHLNRAISRRKEMAGLRRLGRTSASAFSIASATSDSASRSAWRSASETALARGNSRFAASDSDSSARPAFRRHVARLCLASGAATTAADARSSASTRLRLVLARRRAAAIAGGGGSSTSCARNTLPTTSTSAANCSAVSSASISGDFSANSVNAEGGGFPFPFRRGESSRCGSVSVSVSVSGSVAFVPSRDAARG